MIQLSLIIFAVGTIVCGTAHHIATLLIGRTLQGVGGGGMLTMTYVVMADLLDLRERAKGLAVLAIVWAVGSCTGPVMGGAFTTYVTWRWIFWICLPLTGIGLVLTTFFLNTHYKPEEGPSKSLKKVDWGGAAIFVASLTSFFVAISWVRPRLESMITIVAHKVPGWHTIRLGFIRHPRSSDPWRHWHIVVAFVRASRSSHANTPTRCPE